MSYLKIGKYYGSDPNPVIYQIKEVLDANYADITSVYNWINLRDELGKDFLYCKDNATIFIEQTTGFSGLDQLDKECAAQNFCVNKTDRDTIYTDSEQEGYWTQFVINSKDARSLRWNKTKLYVSFRLSKTDSSDLAVDTLVLNERYVEYGIMSFALDGQEGLYDWINGTSSYTDGGFPTKSYYTLDLKNEVLDRLNGLQ
jgi:hypothetical protein